MQEPSPPDILRRIRRTGRVIEVICSISRVGWIVTGVGGVLLTIAMYFGFEAPASIIDDITSNDIFGALAAFADLSSIPAKELTLIRTFTYGIAQLLIAHLVTMFRNLVHGLVGSDQPFTREAATRIRRSIWSFLPLALWNPLLAVVGAFFALLLSHVIEYGAYLQGKANETNRIQEQLIMQFAEITENKSGQTGGHIKRVSEYTRVLADELGMSADEVDQIRLASTMHDIGKLLVPSEILDKPGRLTDEEFAVIRQHTTYGGQLLDNVEGDVMQLSRDIAVDHHERWDGKGYAQGKAGEEISLAGRVVAVADVYDALTSRRSYKDAWDGREAHDEIVRCSGTQFDPQVVAAFEARYDEIEQIRERFQDAS